MRAFFNGFNGVVQLFKRLDQQQYFVTRLVDCLDDSLFGLIGRLRVIAIGVIVQLSRMQCPAIVHGPAGFRQRFGHE